jgi:putative DNA primase/helicase
MHNHGLLCLDEISQVSEKEVGEIVYTLGKGTGKGRMTRQITSRANTQFKLLFLSSGERTLREIMQAAGKQSKGGQESRLIDIPADAGKGWGLFEELHEYPSADCIVRALSEATKTYYGSPIEEFLRLVVADSNAIGQDARREREAFLRKRVPRDAAGEVYRAGSLFGLILAGGELATSFGLTGWKRGAATWAAEACFAAWIQNRGGTGAHDVGSGIDAVRSFLELNGPSRFEDVKESAAGRPVYNRAGFRERVRTDDDDQFVHYIYQDVFKNEVCKGYDYSGVAKELAARGHLQRHESDHLTIQKRIPGQGRFRVFAIRPTIFGDEQENLQSVPGTAGTRIAVA